MQTPAETKKIAWQPITPRGVAAFADASFGRLLGVQLLVASFAAICCSWVLWSAWFPVIHAAIGKLPDEGRVRSAQLEWSGEAVVALAENPFLSVVVDLNHQGIARSPAHVQIEFGQQDWRVLTVFGDSIQKYPEGWMMPFNRRELEPWWGAWAPELLAIFALGVILVLLVNWTVLSSLYFLPAWLVSFFCDRQLSLRGSWRLAGAALMPGAFVMIAGILAYGRGVLSFLELSLVIAAHFVVGWAYLLMAAVARPPRGLAAQNPFGSNPEPSKTSNAESVKPEA